MAITPSRCMNNPPNHIPVVNALKVLKNTYNVAIYMCVKVLSVTTKDPSVTPLDTMYMYVHCINTFSNTPGVPNCTSNQTPQKCVTPTPYF